MSLEIVDTKLFKSGNSVAVRLPKDFGLEAGTDVTVTKSGSTVTIAPRRRSPRELVELLRSMPKPSSIEEREPFEAPERFGL